MITLCHSETSEVHHVQLFDSAEGYGGGTSEERLRDLQSAEKDEKRRQWGKTGEHLHVDMFDMFCIPHVYMFDMCNMFSGRCKICRFLLRVLGSSPVL